MNLFSGNGITHWLSQLIAIDTTTRNSNLPFISLLEEFFARSQIAYRISRDPHQPKANLFATLSSANGDMQGGLVLSGHTDVVPVDGQEWKTSPFQAVEKEGAIYGRGTCDMKGFLAVVLALVPEFQKLRLRRPLHLAFSYDEEGGCFGAPVMIADFKKAGIQPAACIVGEPTEMAPIVGHKGFQVLQFQVYGHAVHSSLTSHGCNAIEYGAQLIAQIRKISDRIKTEGPFDRAYEVPYTTLSTNGIRGGIAVNTIPDLCTFTLDLRQIAGVDPQNIVGEISKYARETLLPMMQQENPYATITLNTLASMPSFASPETAEITQLTRTLLKDQEIRKASYGTEAGLFQQAGIPTIICGPGSVKQAHQPNEFVSVGQLEKCAHFLLNIVKKYCLD